MCVTWYRFRELGAFRGYKVLQELPGGGDPMALIEGFLETVLGGCCSIWICDWIRARRARK